MSPDVTHGGPLAAVAWRAVEQDRAAHALRAAVADAAAAGESISAVADAARVGRQTIYRWLAMEAGDVRTTRRAVTDALLLMSGMVSHPHQASQLLTRALHRDEAVQLRGLAMGRSWITDEAARSMTDEDRATLALAAEYENRVTSRREVARRGGSE